MSKLRDFLESWGFILLAGIGVIAIAAYTASIPLLYGGAW